MPAHMREPIMSASTAIITILAALLLVAMSPGPSFVIVALNSI